MNVLIVPEDSRKDKHILKPLFERLFRSLGRPSANVRVCEDPVLGGVVEALKSAHLSDIVKRYEGMADCFILCVDRDGEVGRRERLDQIEAEFLLCVGTALFRLDRVTGPDLGFAPMDDWTVNRSMNPSRRYRWRPRGVRPVDPSIQI